MQPIKPGYTRVTEVLRPFSGIDSVPPEILKAANHRGSRVHALCQGYIDGIEIECPNEYKGYFDSFKQWAEGKQFMPNPGRMYDDQWMITGECDGIYVSDMPIIFDLKTSQKESKTWKLQGAAYNLLCGTIYPDQVFVILDKSGGSPTECRYHYKENIDTFLKCVDLYNIFFKKRNPIEVEFL